MIRLYNIGKIYKSAHEEQSALRNITLSIKKGEFVSITGPSGSGKSTLMDIIGMIERPSFGKYVFENTDVSLIPENDMHALRNAKIGLMFQSCKLLPHLNLFQNLEIPLLYQGLGVGERKERVMQHLQNFDILELAALYPKDLNRGQQQTAAIARAMLTQPDLLIADEPTGDLDSHTGEEILLILQKLNEMGMTILLITHDVEIAKHAKRVVCLKDGNLIKDVYLSHPLSASEVMQRMKHQQI